MKEIWQKINKYYFTNFALSFALVFAIILSFFVQFRVEKLQDEIASAQDEIAFLEDEIQILEVNWVYLTRPARLRELSSIYLQNNGYALASQIKNEEQVRNYHLINYQKEEFKEEVVDL